MPRVILTECTDPHWIEVARRLSVEAGWTLVYVTAATGQARIWRTAFPEVVYHDSLQAVRGIVPPELSGMAQHPLDADTLAGLQPYEGMALTMMGRMDPDGRSFTFEERHRHFRRLARYWTTVLSTLQPDLVFFPITPHAIYDYVLYALCRQRGVQTVMFDRTAVPGRVLIQAAFEDGSPELEAAASAARPRARLEQLPEHVRSYVQRVRASYEQGMPPNLSKKLSGLGQDPPSWSRRSSVPREILAELRRFLAGIPGSGWQAPVNYLKERGRPIEESDLSPWRWELNRFRGIRRKAGLRDLYRSLERHPDLTRPYVFLALHYQPERNTVPLGGSFADQILVCELLSSAVPADWKIYVKEHNWQFHARSKGELARNETFYRDIASLPNVELVPLETSPFDLIDHAEAVATVAGSAGWEALVRGRPALVFGSAWYQHCPGAFRVRSVDACVQALQHLPSAVSESDVCSFLLALEDVAVRAAIEPQREDLGDVPPGEAVEHLACSLRDFTDR